MLPAVHWSALVVKVIVLLLWHAIRHPHAPSTVDLETGTVRLVGG